MKMLRFVIFFGSSFVCWGSLELKGLFVFDAIEYLGLYFYRWLKKNNCKCILMEIE